MPTLVYVDVCCLNPGQADLLLTTDDRFIHRAMRVSSALRVRVLNPIT